MDRRKFVTLGGVALAAGQWGMPAWAQQQGVYRIGSLNPITGSGSPYGTGMLKAIQFGAAEINDDGGAGGMKFEVYAEDSQTSPQAAVLGAKKLIGVDKVKAMLGVWSSGESLAVIPITNEANMILMNTAGAPALSVPPANAKHLSFRFQATNERFGRAFAQIAKRQGFKRPATMAFNNASGIGNTEGFRKAWEAMGGKVVANVVYEPNQPTYRSEVAQILRANPDVIVTGSYLADTTLLLRAWYETGQPVHWIIPGWAGGPPLIKALGPKVTDGIISVESISNEGAPTYKSFVERFFKKTGLHAQDNVYATMAYDEVILLGLAVQAVGPNASGEALAAKIHEIGNSGGTEISRFAEGKKLIAAGKRVSYIGASSRLDFDKYNDVTPDFSASFAEHGEFVRKYIVKI
ncbi:amino acid ABC transporter substrate-binding protein [Pandoraea thiooxydans]|uniref:Amino acid ABC transporter substrate-binding protein n=1 Tax=Pandoraea thiooxydans TaxID=445709 RepID=A0A0G3EP95_9BURK|nr:ABC transporter substrate-binding protein [Pandoraea thiooxydans]AKJ67142.1 amino acid ABC transporter substrate-binding protein [Pandoraea thiooxydans]APR94103.1 amino acid ABC transporter substrate-binding protein [Pandoraea thiooxydans]